MVMWSALALQAGGFWSPAGAWRCLGRDEMSCSSPVLRFNIWSILVTTHQRGHGDVWEGFRGADFLLFGLDRQVELQGVASHLNWFDICFSSFPLSSDRGFRRREVDIRKRSRMLQVTDWFQKVSRHGFEHIYASLGCFTESTWYLKFAPHWVGANGRVSENNIHVALSTTFEVALLWRY